MKILHLCVQEKFTPPLIEFVRENFVDDEHMFMTFGDHENFPYEAGKDTMHVGSQLKQILSIIRELNSADKIIVHSFARHFIIFFLQPWLLGRAYWVIWGGDLYNNISPSGGLKSLLKWRFFRCIIKGFGGIVCFVKGDYELAVKTFGTKAPFIECVLYGGNVDFFDLEPKEDLGSTKTILLGNSASMSNEHEYALDKLAPFKNENIRIICPLSYHDDGGAGYLDSVIQKGSTIFGDKFVPIMDYMPLNDYLEILSTVDICVFGHKRQQGLGNAITVLGSGKKVFMRNDITSWDFFSDLGVEVYDVESFSLDPMDPVIAKNNAILIREYFSKENALKQMNNLYKY
ncbi:MAG: hypothetical protein COA45_12000 [Zetaproteobacteria bacterium]|nr:MAG: hypothetical protein COA45_12000 [Zetaproteobacteria bacterium]